MALFEGYERKIDKINGVLEAAIVALGLLQRFVGVVALLDEVHHLAQVDELIADDQVVLVQSAAGDIALGHFQIPGSLDLGGEHGAHLAAQALAQVLQRSAHCQAALGERRLAAAVDDLQEQLPHSGIDGVAHQVGIQRLQDGLTDQDLGSHSRGVGHTGAAQGLDQSLLDDAFLHVQGQLAGTLLGSAPAHTVGETADVLDFLGLNPLTLFRDRRRAVIGALGNAYHFLNFAGILHGSSSFFIARRPGTNAQTALYYHTRLL